MSFLTEDTEVGPESSGAAAVQDGVDGLSIEDEELQSEEWSRTPQGASFPVSATMDQFGKAFAEKKNRKKTLSNTHN